ncbi:MAG: cytochrome b [Proteobacteria bacterium]|nr:cytochrome b [Pseudomonadota bacterium]
MSSPADTPDASQTAATRYDDMTIVLHWVTALLVLTQFALAELWEFFPRPDRHLMIVAHMSFGIVLGALVAFRVVWRLAAGRRVQAVFADWMDVLAKTVHWLLYGLLLAQAVLGFLMRWSGDEAMSFFGLQIPPPFAPWSKAAQHLTGETHEKIGWAIIILAAGHVGAAVYHQRVLRDGVLARMLPRRG